MGSKLECSARHQGLHYPRKAALALSVKSSTSGIIDTKADTTRQVSPLCRKHPHHQPYPPNSANNVYSMTQEGQGAPKRLWVFIGWAVPIHLQKHKSRCLVNPRHFSPGTQYSNRAKTATLYFEYLHHILRTQQFGVCGNAADFTIGIWTTATTPFLLLSLLPPHSCLTFADALH